MHYSKRKKILIIANQFYLVTGNNFLMFAVESITLVLYLYNQIAILLFEFFVRFYKNQKMVADVEASIVGT